MKKLFVIIAVLICVAFLMSDIQAQETFKLNYKFKKGKTYRYKEMSDGKIKQEMMGREIKMTSGSEIVNKYVINNVDKNGNITLIFSAESAQMTSKSPMADTTLVLTELIDKRSKVVLNNLGKINSREIIDTVVFRSRMAGAAQRELIKFPIFSQNAVKFGDSWKSTLVDTIEQMGGKITTTTEIEYKLTGKEKKFYRDCLKIDFVGNINTEGKANMQGMELFIEGSGKTTGVLYFDPKAGLLIYEEADTDTETTMATTGEQAMMIPISQSVKSTRTLLK